MSHPQNESNLIIDIPSIRAVSVSVRGKKVFYKSLTKEQIKKGELIRQETLESLKPIVEEHGRHAVLTFKLLDGTKRRYRGNGSILLEPTSLELTEYAQKVYYEALQREAFLDARRKEQEKKEPILTQTQKAALDSLKKLSKEGE